MHMEVLMCTTKEGLQHSQVLSKFSSFCRPATRNCSTHQTSRLRPESIVRSCAVRSTHNTKRDGVSGETVLLRASPKRQWLVSSVDYVRVYQKEGKYDVGCDGVNGDWPSVYL